MTGDPEVAEHLAHTTGVPWSTDLWLEGGCGVLPIEYKEKNLIHSWQWAIGLEWFLSVDDPWRVIATDHPNSALHGYPILMQLLGDESFRRDAFRRIHRPFKNVHHSHQFLVSIPSKSYALLPEQHRKLRTYERSPWCWCGCRHYRL